VILDAANAAELADDAAAARALEGLNVVLVDQPPGRWPGVASDALAAGRLAAEHLLGLGHSRLAFVGPAADVHAFRQRERGFVQALRAAGVALPSAWLRRAPATAAGGMRAMRALLAERPRPTAVFCANDLAAVGALKACAAAGVRVPAELSLVGCDDVELASLVSPELTTVRVPARELGARAARLLVQRLAAPAPGAPGAPAAGERRRAAPAARDGAPPAPRAPRRAGHHRARGGRVTARAPGARGAVITGTGSFAPARVVTNAELSAALGTDVDPFVRGTLGIAERRWCGDGESTADLAEAAARRALDDAGVAPETSTCWSSPPTRPSTSRRRRRAWCRGGSAPCARARST
jgi:hypothetical protein